MKLSPFEYLFGNYLNYSSKLHWWATFLKRLRNSSNDFCSYWNVLHNSISFMWLSSLRSQKSLIFLTPTFWFSEYLPSTRDLYFSSSSKPPARKSLLIFFTSFTGCKSSNIRSKRLSQHVHLYYLFHNYINYIF